jgi:hypothetical protein
LMKINWEGSSSEGRMRMRNKGILDFLINSLV